MELSVYSSTHVRSSQAYDDARRLAAKHKDRAAWLYRTRFRWDVRPAVPMGKRPLVPWSLKRTPEPLDPDDLWECWQNVPAANVAILTGGRSRLAVLDLDNDPKHALSLDERLSLLAEHGWPVSETCIERTPRRGVHLYFTLPAGTSVRSRDAYLTSGVELKGDGRLVIATPSPSMHGHYRWLDWRDPWTTPPAKCQSHPPIGDGAAPSAWREVSLRCPQHLARPNGYLDGNRSGVRHDSSAPLGTPARGSAAARHARYAPTATSSSWNRDSP